jgi:hypothetical protein
VPTAEGKGLIQRTFVLGAWVAVTTLYASFLFVEGITTLTTRGGSTFTRW